MKTLVCPECGATFESTRCKVYCSKKCQKKCQKKRSRRRAAPRKRGIRDFGATIRATKPVTQEELMRARKKPGNCSALRWRIELRRRARDEYFRVCGDSLPR